MIKKLKNHGLTLLEILIAILVLSLLMISILKIIDNQSNMVTTIMSEDREFIQVEAALNRVILDITQIYSPLYFSIPAKNNDNQSNDYIDQNSSFPSKTIKNLLIPAMITPESSTFIFLSSGNRRKFQDIKQSEYAWIKYTLRNSTSNKIVKDAPYELVRYSYANNPYATEFHWESVKPIILIKNIKKLKFQFWDDYKQDFVNSLETIDSKDKAIRLIKLELTWINKNNVEENIEKWIRPLWPYFDASIDKKYFSSSTNKSTTLGSTSQNFNDDQNTDNNYDSNEATNPDE